MNIRKRTFFVIIIILVIAIFANITIAQNKPDVPQPEPRVQRVAGLNAGFIVALIHDGLGGAWVGTEDYGVFLYQVDGKVSQFTTKNGLGDNNGYALAIDKLGRLVQQTRFDSDKPIIVTKNKFDQAGRLTNISHTGNGKTYADYDLTWDNANRITDFDFTYLNGPAKRNESKYRYDKTSQLIAANYNFMQNEMYDFDLNGNRKKAKIQDKNESYKTGEYNRLLSDENYRYEYDAEGNRIAKISKDGKTTKYFWDHRNRLVKVQTPTETVNYIYDYQNRLTVRKQDKNETIFIHDEWQVILTFDLTKRFITEYFWGSQQDELICYGVNWTLCDHLNTIRDIIKSDGTVVSHLEYNAFGKLISETKKDPFFFGYTGKLFDKVSDLQWNINRWYDSNIGKWMSEDPIGFNGCDNNLYRYVGNVLLNLIDPDGELPIVSIIVGASCVACYGAMASMLSTAWDICWNSEGPIAFSTCMIDKINQMESSLDTYSWTVINGACLCCGGGIGKAASKHFIPKLLNKYTASKIAKCEAIYIAYKALNCEGCRHAGITVAECVVRAACLTSEMLGRSEYLLNKCDYFLPGSISFGSKRKERAHLQHLETTVVNTLKRCKRCASL
jgi:RHS repeat-associated protein